MAPESQEQTSIHGLRGLISKTAHKTAVLSSLVAALFGVPAGLAHASEMSDINKLMRAGQYAEALTKTDAVLAKHPRDAQLRFTKGLILAEQSRSAEAIAVFSKLTEDFPDLPEPYNNLAVLYAADGQYDKARAALDMAMRTNPTYATALENLGDVYAKLASQAYDKALQIDPGANVPQPKLTLLRSLNGNTTGGTVPRLASAASAQRDAKAKADASAAEQQQRAKALAAEKAAQQAAADKAEAEKTAIAKATADKEKAQADKAAADKAASDKAAAEKAAADKAAADKARADKARSEQLAAEQARAQKAAADKAAAEQKQAELLAQKEKDKADKLAKEQAARAEKEKAAQAAAEKARADKLASAEKAKADKARADKDKAKAEASAEQEKSAVLAALNGWAKSWSDKDVRSYLGHYASDFDTPRGASRKEWAEERRARIEDKGRISVKVSNATVSISGNTATVRYRQIYNSDRLTVDSRKTLIFVKQGNRWLIKQERSGG
ncbi:YybH family protein [Herbaspirillum frisingense]|uniref:YybH family protein n=1 Tax=Herbaspirillum frisingense TaxID=92645 RepID=UPI002DD43D9B|nr:tetratricopeptide repeat protein [Herbaspirillum frisingense]